MSPRRKGLTFDDVRAIAHALPGVEDDTHFGTPSLKVRKKLIVRLKEDGETLVLRVPFVVRDHLMTASPDVYHITDHYRDHPSVLVRLANANRAELAALIEDAWRAAAPKRLVQERDATMSDE